jgi:uncharacterized membrane protein
MPWSGDKLAAGPHNAQPAIPEGAPPVTMDDLIVARAVHVVAVLLWIGGVAFVTLVLLPAVRRSTAPDRRLEDFHRFEARFASQARLWVVAAGLSGLWLLWRADLWSRFADPHAWWMHAMVALWLAFAAMLFVVEPFHLHRRMAASPDPAADFRRLERLHRALLGLALLTLAGAVAGSHGWAF